MNLNIVMDKRRIHKDFLLSRLTFIHYKKENILFILNWRVLMYQHHIQLMPFQNKDLNYQRLH
jgi:hypothetical protein